MAGRTSLARITNRIDSVWRPSRSSHAGSHADAVLDYPESFEDTARAFQEFVRRCDLSTMRPDSAANGRSVAVAVLPWAATPAPWFSIALGIGLARRGANVTFIHDDSAFPLGSSQLDSEGAWIGRILEDLRPHFPVARLSEEQPHAEHAEDEAVLEQLVRLNLVWAIRGGTPNEAELATAYATRNGLGETLTRIRAMLARMAFRYVVVPGGVYGTSGLYLHAGQMVGTRVATFDSGPGWSIVCPHGVAAHQVDVPRAFEALHKAAEPELDEAIETARSAFDLRVQGDDPMAYQAARFRARDPFADSVLIPLSVEWDTAALGRHHIFQNSADWLVATIQHVLKSTDAPVIVRQHPSERRDMERSRFDVLKLLDDVFGEHPRLRFVGANEDVNTYDLLRSARVVLPYVSTLGIEAAALGKIVIPSGQPYYGVLGFTWNVSSRAEYFNLIELAVGGALPSLPDQIRKAWLCFYINAVCYRVFTTFSPQPTDFLKWCRWDPDALFATSEVQDLLTAIDEDRPVPLIQHARRTAGKRTNNGGR